MTIGILKRSFNGENRGRDGWFILFISIIVSYYIAYGTFLKVPLTIYNYYSDYSKKVSKYNIKIN